MQKTLKFHNLGILFLATLLPLSMIFHPFTFLLWLISIILQQLCKQSHLPSKCQESSWAMFTFDSNVSSLSVMKSRIWASHNSWTQPKSTLTILFQFFTLLLHSCTIFYIFFFYILTVLHLFVIAFFFHRAIVVIWFEGYIMNFRFSCIILWEPSQIITIGAFQKHLWQDAS